MNRGPGPGGAQPLLDQNAAVVVKNGPGYMFTAVVTAAGSSPGALYDNNQTGASNTTANLIGYIGEDIGSYPFYGFPFVTGLVFVPGGGQVANISFT